MTRKTRIRILSGIAYSSAAALAGLMMAPFELRWCLFSALFAGFCGFFLGPFVFNPNRWVSYLWVLYNSLLIPGLSLLLTGLTLALISLAFGKVNEETSLLGLIGAPLMFGSVVYPFLFLMAFFASCALLFSKPRV